MFHVRVEAKGSPQGENTVCGCNAITGPVYYISSDHVHGNAEKGGTMTQKSFERVKQATQNVTYDHMRLDLPDEAICDIVDAIEENGAVLRFLARR